MKNKFNNNGNKRLTMYELKCGYIQQKLTFSDHLFSKKVYLYHDGIYQVRAFRYYKNSSSVDKLSWESFESLTDARKFYSKLCKIHSK